MLSTLFYYSLIFYKYIHYHYTFGQRKTYTCYFEKYERLEGSTIELVL
jgi:hypothetical protein